VRPPRPTLPSRWPLSGLGAIGLEVDRRSAAERPSDPVHEALDLRGGVVLTGNARDRDLDLDPRMRGEPSDGREDRLHADAEPLSVEVPSRAPDPEVHGVDAVEDDLARRRREISRGR